MKGPSRSKPGGLSVIGHYRVEDGFVVMCKPDGAPIELNGKRLRRKFGTQSGELNEREVARVMTLEIRDELKRSGTPLQRSSLVDQFRIRRGFERGRQYSVLLVPRHQSRRAG